MADNRGVSVEELAAQPIDDDDVRLLTELAAAATAADPVPDGLVERIQFGMTLEALHAEIAELQRLDALAGVRGEAAEANTITFTSPSLTTMVTVTPAGPDRVRIDGWAASGGGVSVELRTADGVMSTRADADGRFVFDDVPRGLAQFLLRHPEGSSLPAVATPSIEF
jgi:hypothetical protein